MKRFAFAVCLIVLGFAVSVWAQTQAPKPGPEIKKFDVFLGHWTYTVEYKAGPLGPASNAAGELTIQAILGGSFFQNQVTERGPLGEAQIMEIIGYDPASNKFTSNEYHSDGTVFAGTYSTIGNTWTYTGKTTVEGKSIVVKNVLTVAADSVLAKGEVSMDGNTWAPWLEAKYARVKAAPEK